MWSCWELCLPANLAKHDDWVRPPLRYLNPLWSAAAICSNIGIHLDSDVEVLLICAVLRRLAPVPHIHVLELTDTLLCRGGRCGYYGLDHIAEFLCIG
jgi:hypothetical protein